MEPLACSNQPLSLGWTPTPIGKPRGVVPDDIELPPKFLEGVKEVEDVAPQPDQPQAEDSEPSPDWRTPVRAVEVGTWAPIPGKNKKGEDTVSRVPVTLGVRVHMKDGSTWYHHHRTGSWTRRTPGVGRESQSRMTFPGEAKDVGEKKDESILHSKLRRDALAGKWPGRKMLDALNWGLDHAESWRAQ